MRHTLPRRAAAMAVVLAGTAAGCSDAVTDAAIAAPGQDLRAVIEAQGFRADMIEDFGSYYLVEGDITFEKSALRRMAAGGPSLQYTTTNLVSAANVAQIKVDVSSIGANPEWQQAIRDALPIWSGISGSYVRMTEGTPADIVVTSECRNDGVLARVTAFPASGEPGPGIVVNNCWVVNGQPATPSQSARLKTAVHELGHSIGFRHSNWNQVDCWGPCGGNAGPEGANHVSGTPTSGNDPNSVMNGGNAGAAWAGFSSHDTYATRVRYPLPQPAVVLSYPGSTPTLTWGALTGASSYRVDFITERYYVGMGTYEVEEAYVGVTTGTTVVDGYRSHTGNEMCEIRGTHQGGVEEYYSYRVEARFSTGNTVRTLPAAVGDC